MSKFTHHAKRIILTDDNKKLAYKIMHNVLETLINDKEIKGIFSQPKDNEVSHPLDDIDPYHFKPNKMDPRRNKENP